MMSDGGNASTIHHSYLFMNFHILMNNLVWDSDNLNRSNFILEEGLRTKVVSTAKILANRIDRYSHDITIYFDYGYKPEYVDFHLNSIRQLSQKLICDLLLDEGNEHLKLIDDINIFIDSCNSRIDFLNGIQAIEHDLYRYAHVISQNKYLYKIENGSTLFQETNIAGIYKELLAASASGKYIDYSQEEINGNGRTDIQIRCQKETIGIIEIKLLKKGDENRTEAIRKGLDQLYERYSQNHYRRIENQIILKLVLFCYDPNMRNLIGSIKNAIVEHEQRVGVKFTVFDPCKRNTIRIKLEESIPFKNKGGTYRYCNCKIRK
ncbi:PD-(D/E)XK nuclease domain-containing protein [Providencia hangzhouensis]|uniref:PD-(D/E)XK nuclease domain-containing protein n=1 Tax=Providencia hangzhouensis TaxID=3031799 RepID=UPI0034DD9228